MKTIHRGHIPDCLKKQPVDQRWWAFMNTPCHTEVHGSLRQEQQGLCCYCEIELSDNNGHIEHMEPRSLNSSRTYDYSNLVLSCNGGSVEHCGHYKDNRAYNRRFAWDSGRFLPPHDPDTVLLFRYLQDGSVGPTDGNDDRAFYLIGYLGLDCARLSDRRREHARTLIDTLGEEPDPKLVAWLRQDHLETDTSGQLKQFYSLSKQILEP